MIVLQKFDFRESKYERPNDKWVCGHLADGKPCTLGPGPDGKCRVTTVCQPRLENGRWHCRRSLQEGGPCQSGPRPDGQCCQLLKRCVPRPTLRVQRGRSGLWAVAVVIGVLALALGATEYLMPGQLSSRHANLSECSSCHAGAGPGRVDVLHQLVMSAGPQESSKLCLGCHEMGGTPFTPHTRPIEEMKLLAASLLAKSKDAPTESWVQRIAFPAPAAKSLSPDTEVYCATCHKEHEGVFHNLRTVSNERCQTCHVAKYGSFADSHPQFTKYPYPRRTRIIFDHQGHLEKHFAETSKTTPGLTIPKECSNCHLLGVRQKYVETRPYETMCAACHNGDIMGETRVSGPKGVDFFTVPGLDVATLESRGVDIGDWPKLSEAGLTPFMRLLLKSNGEDPASGVAGLSLLDLSQASDAALGRVEALAWAIKRLFNRLESGKLETAMAAPIESSKERVDRVRLAALTGGMSHDVIRGGNREWFPNLKEDLERHDKGEPTRGFKPPEKAPDDAAKPASSPLPASASSGDILSPGGSATGGSDAPAVIPGKAATDDILGDGSKPTDDILAGGSKPTDDILGGGAKADDGGLTQGGSGDSILSSPPEGDTPTAVEKSATAPPPEAFDPEVWAESGGWYRQDFAIRYRPSGHADRFLRSWLDFASQAYGTDMQNQLAPIFVRLAPQEAIGRCTKCHSVDTGAGATNVNWQPFDPNKVKKRFTGFAHKPHVDAVGSKGCAACHELKQTGSQYLKTYEAGDPAKHAPNFLYLEKSLCATCHVQQAVWERCTLCHNYHVNEVVEDQRTPRTGRQP